MTRMLAMRRRLFWKIYLTMLAGILLVGLLLGIAWRVTTDRVWAQWRELRQELAAVSLPVADEPPGTLDRMLEELSETIDADVSLYSPDRHLIAAGGEPIGFSRRGDGFPGPRHATRVDLPDGRILLARIRPPSPEPVLRILVLVVLIGGGVGLAAYPVTRRLTRRLERLRSGVESWGTGRLMSRVDEEGSDEIADVAKSFNTAASRVEALLASQKALLANASHELRSPLARLRMAVEMWTDHPSAAARDEIARNLTEIDALVEEILLASRLDHDRAGGRSKLGPVDLLGLAAEEAARADASVDGEPVEVVGDATLLRRMIRNLLDNAVKHGARPVEIAVARGGPGAVVTVADRGSGIPEAERERVFEPFYRPKGRSEAAGGWGLGLSLVRQIVGRHGGRVACTTRDGGGTVITVSLPLAAPVQAGAG
jgi:signal transduction histidine kinase